MLSCNGEQLDFRRWNTLALFIDRRAVGLDKTEMAFFSGCLEVSVKAAHLCQTFSAMVIQ